MCNTSQLAEPLWTDPGIKSGISLRELISTSKEKEEKKRKQKKSTGRVWMIEYSSKSLANEKNATNTTSKGK